MALIDNIERMLPSWAIKRFHWLQLGAAMALVIDALIEGARDGVLAAMPGQLDDLPMLGGFVGTDGLPLLGRDRGLVQGLAESTGAFAARLRAWRRIARRRGLAFGLLEQIRAAFSPSSPRVRLVTGAGIWRTIEADGTMKLHTPDGTGFELSPAGESTPLTTEAHPWDWDGSGNPFQAFLIIYAPNVLIPGDEGTWDDGEVVWGQEGSWGVDATPALGDQLRGIVSEWLPSGCTCPWIIIAFDDASFDPETAGPYPAAGMPDGTWGRYGRLDGTDYVRTRLDTARYVRGTL